MPILSYRGQSTHKIATGQSNNTGDNKIYNTYLNDKQNIPYQDFDAGLYLDKKSKNTYYDSTYENAILTQGYMPLGGGDKAPALDWLKFFGATGYLILPNPFDYMMHLCDRSITTDLSARIKTPLMIAHYGSNKNGSMRYLPNKKNPKLVDLYAHPLLQNILTAKRYGGINKVLKKDIINISANQLPSYFAKNEKYFLDENDNLRSMEVWNNYQKTGVMNWGNVYYPPELDDKMGWGYHIFSDEFRRQCANFGYYSVNRLETVYEDNPQAASNYLNAYLKLRGLDDKTRDYYDIELEEKTYSAEKVFGEVFTKVFGNFDESNATFTYKDKLYRIDENTNTIYDGNNDEVLYIKLDDGTYFSTSYEKAIVRALKDEIKPYIDSFIQFMKNKPDIVSMNGNEFFQWWNVIHSENVQYSSGWETETWCEVEQKFQNYNYTQAECNRIINQVNGLYMSANRLDISQLISVSDKYIYASMQLSKTQDDLSNSSYENSMMTPIFIPNYIDYYTEVGVNTTRTGTTTVPIVGSRDEFQYNTYRPDTRLYKNFYGDTFKGYDHSTMAEHYAYFKDTTPLNSVLDNYLGYDRENQKIVFKTDDSGETLWNYDDEGNKTYPIIDEEKTVYGDKIDPNSNLSQPERIYQVLTKYPYLIDLENMSVEDSVAYTHTITFTELSRNQIDSSLKDNMGNTLKNYEIEVEPMFQVKEIKYNMGVLPYYKVYTDGSNSTQNIEYIQGYNFSPLFYVFDTDNFNMHLWRSIPTTKKFKFVFMKDIIDELEKVGNNYVEVRYSYNEDGVRYDKSVDIDGDINDIRLNFCGNKVSYKMVKYCPQILLAVGSNRLVTKERTAMVATAGIAAQILTWVGIKLLWSPYPVNLFAAVCFASAFTTYMASRREFDCHTIGYKYNREGDFFYNIGNKWEFLYNKNNGKRPDLWDKFENPSYSMEIQDPTIEKRVKKNPSAARIFTDRDFKARKKKYDPYVGNDIPTGLEYTERPFIASAFTADELKAKIDPKTRFKGNISTKEEKIYETRSKFTDDYNNYLQSDKVMNITHIYYGQKFCLTWLLNGHLRKVQSLLHSAYTYLDYLCGIKGIISGEKYVSVIIPHRMQLQALKKNIRIGRFALTENDLAELGDKNYKLSIVVDKFYILNKKTKIKVMIDFKSYIPDYRTHYSTNNQVANIKASLLPEIKTIYSGGDIYGWKSWYDRNINEISNNGEYLSVDSEGNSVFAKVSDDELGTMEDFMREYLSTLKDEELLQIYNEDNNTDYKYVVNTAYSSENTLDTNGEINQFVESSVTEGSITTVKNFTLSKIREGLISASYSVQKDGYVNPVYYFTSDLTNERITYDIRTLCLGYQIALEKIMQGKSENTDENFKNRFYTYLDAEEGTISKTTIINHIINKLQEVIPSSIIITLNEMRDILNVTNKYTNLFDLDPLNVNSISYNLWTRYYVGPDEIKDKLLELQEDIVSWKVLLDKNTQLTRDANDRNNNTCAMLPMYQDVWKKLNYNAKLFYSQYSFTYDLYAETFIPQRMSSYDASLVRTFIIWKGLFVAFLAIIIAIVLAIVGGLLTPLTGGTSTILSVAGIIAILTLASIVLAGVAFICQAIGAYSSNPATQKKYAKLAKAFSTAATITGIAAGIMSIGNSIKELSAKMAEEATKLATKELVQEISWIVAQSVVVGSAIVVATTSNDSVKRTWSIVGLSGAILGAGLKANAYTKDSAGKEVLDVAKTAQNYLKIMSQITDLINQILTCIYSGKLENIQADLKQLEELNKQLEEEIEEEELEQMQSPMNMLAMINARTPLKLEKYEDFPNLLLNDSQLPSTDTDEIIDATFEILDS